MFNIPSETARWLWVALLLLTQPTIKGIAAYYQNKTNKKKKPIHQVGVVKQEVSQTSVQSLYQNKKQQQKNLSFNTQSHQRSDSIRRLTYTPNHHTERSKVTSMLIRFDYQEDDPTDGGDDKDRGYRQATTAELVWDGGDGEHEDKGHCVRWDGV